MSEQKEVRKKRLSYKYTKHIYKYFKINYHSWIGLVTKTLK